MTSVIISISRYNRTITYVPKLVPNPLLSCFSEWEFLAKDQYIVAGPTFGETDFLTKVCPGHQYRGQARDHHQDTGNCCGGGENVECQCIALNKQKDGDGDGDKDWAIIGRTEYYPLQHWLSAMRRHPRCRHQVKINDWNCQEDHLCLFKNEGSIKQRCLTMATVMMMVVPLRYGLLAAHHAAYVPNTTTVAMDCPSNKDRREEQSSPSVSDNESSQLQKKHRHCHINGILIVISCYSCWTYYPPSWFDVTSSTAGITTNTLKIIITILWKAHLRS